MPKIKRSNYVRRRTPYKKTYRKTSTKRIRKIAVKAIKSLSETKQTFIQYSPKIVLTDQWYALNLFHDISQGTGDDRRIGDKIYMNNVTFRLNLRYNPGGTTPGQQVNIRIMIVRNKTRQSNFNLAGNFPIWGGDTILKSGYPMNGMVDTEKFTVLKDRRYQINPLNDVYHVTNWYKSITLKVNKNIQYDADNGGYMKFQNTYLLWHIYGEGPQVVDPFSAATYKMNILQSHKFKDL